MALNNPSSDSFQSTVILLQCSFLPHYSKTKRFLGPKGRMLLTKSELSFSLEVVSAVSGSVVMVLQITSLTFSWTSAPSTSLSWDINHRQQYSELTTWKIEVHDRGGSRIFFRRVCTRLLLYFNTNKPHSFLFLQNTSCIRKPQVISGGEGGGHTPYTLPLDPPQDDCMCTILFSYVMDTSLSPYLASLLK